MEERRPDITDEEWLHGKWLLLYNEYGFDPNKTKFCAPFDAAAAIDFTKFKRVVAPTMKFYADPFVTYKDNKYYIFFEEFDFKRGSISCLTLDDKVTPVNVDGVQVHLSFPNVFEHDGDMYMIPESCHLNKINLYKAVEFPHKWVLHTTLVDNIHSGDNQLFFYGGKCWMFCMVYHEGTNHFCIYHSDSLFGKWMPHSILNIRSNGKNNDITRGAGRIFVDSVGRIIRPAQYSRRGINGEGVILYHIINITENSYEEEPINIIMPTDVSPDLRAMHTLSVYNGLVAIDGRQGRSTDYPYVKINLEDEIEIIKNINKNSLS